MGLALGVLALSPACKAPGMKMNARPSSSSRPSALRVGDLNLNLRAITPDLVSSGSARPLPPASEMEGLFTPKAGPYRIGPQDVLLATVWDHPEITMPMGPNRTDSSSGLLVDEDGYLFFPYVGKLRVSGLTASELRDIITTRLSSTLRNPQVDVKVLAYRSQKVYIGGEVRNPAVYNVNDVPFTLSEAINRAGGFLPTADDTRLQLTRGSHSWTLNFRDIMGAGAKLPGQILLRDGDSLQIASTTETPVYLMGEVVRPGTVPMIHGTMSLARAISEAGGLQMASADATSVYVVRSAGTAKNVDVFHLDARNPASMVLADKFALNPNDVVYVDAGTLVRFSRIMNMILPTITATTQAAVVPVQISYLKRNS
jgi:polysaccharide export outer membrane protein